MTRIPLALLTAIALAGPTAAMAQTKPTRPQPSSYAPGPHSGPHVYGSPIGPPIVGPARVHHRIRATADRPASTAREGHAQTARRRPPAPARAPS